MKEGFHEDGDIIAQMPGYELDEETGGWKPVVIEVRFGIPIMSAPPSTSNEQADIGQL